MKPKEIQLDELKTLSQEINVLEHGFCPKCKKYVHHLVWKGELRNGFPNPSFSDEVMVRG